MLIDMKVLLKNSELASRMLVCLFSAYFTATSKIFLLYSTALDVHSDNLMLGYV